MVSHNEVCKWKIIYTYVCSCYIVNRWWLNTNRMYPIRYISLLGLLFLYHLQTLLCSAAVDGRFNQTGDLVVEIRQSC